MYFWRIARMLILAIVAPSMMTNLEKRFRKFLRFFFAESESAITNLKFSFEILKSSFEPIYVSRQKKLARYT